MKLHPATTRNQAMTLFEVIIALLLTALLSLAVVTFIMYTGRTLAGLANHVDLNFGSRMCVDKMSRDIRQARYLKTLQTNQIALVDYDGADLTFEYRPAQRTLVRMKNGEEIMLKDCNSLTFIGYKPNPTAGTFDLVPTTDPALATLVRLNWQCGRLAWGAKTNSETLQTASILIRKNQLRP
jgi:hypothetical protein